LSWLSSLPHQIPFRAASAVRSRDEKNITGLFLWTANETLPPELMLVEAMAQFAGGLAFHERGHGMLTGIESCEVKRAITAGDAVLIHVTLEADFGGTYRFSGTASIDGLECGRGRFYLAEVYPERSEGSVDAPQ
jgi:3-hydroxymyristoyl/3-hydroxydecanoyl-(acyl carrier protein) dehydratase